MIDTSFLHELDRFSLIIRKRVTSKYTGPRKSVAMGRGMLFKDHRLYAPGDDFRSIDWKVYARTDDLYIKNYEEERNLVVHIIVDCSSSMNFGKPITKFEYASMIGIGFAYLAMKENEKFQFSTFSEGLEVFQSRRGMSQLAAMIHHLNNLKTRGISKIKDAILQYRKLIGSRSLIILISDFLIDMQEIKEALYAFGNHEVKVIQVLDPIEKELKFEGDFKLKDSETHLKMKTFISPRLRTKYTGLLEEHTAKIGAECGALGVGFYQFTTDTSIFDAFYKMLERF
ncbi:DUF58 domain-containing protein [Candidatus Woesearchaeota archaeon]|nr:DUF58 domain-containing protein [Candidatus Woesearchaeota archaeon]